MQWTYILFLLCTYTFLPFGYSHITDPKTSLQSCKNLDRLDKTIHRVSPIIDRIVRHNEAKRDAIAAHHSHGHQARDFDEWVKKIQSMQETLGLSQDKIYHKKLNCSDLTLTASPKQPRYPLAERFPKRADCDDDEEEDDDDDDERCSLVDVLDELVDTLECLLEFVVGLLEPILDLVFKLLSSILDTVSDLLD